MKWPWKRQKTSTEAEFTKALTEAPMSVWYLSACDRCGADVQTQGHEPHRPLCSQCARELRIRDYDRQRNDQP
jgi:hypothetical protein